MARSGGQERFERAIAYFIERVVRGKPVCNPLYSQVTSTLHRDDDRDVAERIVNMVPERHNIINCTGSYDHFQLKQLYSHLDVLVGTRFHSVIFSLTSHVPAVAIEYEYKTGGIMNDLGLSQWVIPIEEVTAENLYEKFLQLENEKEWYARHLHQVLPEYIVKAKEVARQMKEIYCAIQGKKTSHFGC